MTLVGAVLGALLSAGIVLILSRLREMRVLPLAARVDPWLRDLAPAATGIDPVSAGSGVFGPILSSAGRSVEKVFGGAASVERRLNRAGLAMTVHEFRMEQALWGIVGFAAAALWGVIRAVNAPGTVIASAIVCVCAFALGVMLRDNRLSSQAKKREAQMSAEFPVLAELLALAVGAGESPVVALERVVSRSGGELAHDLGRVLGEIRTGSSVAHAFDGLAARTGLPVVARFASGIAVAMERGTPLADVLHAQASDVREASRRELIEVAARKEVLMMVPVVFLVLPLVVVFAFYPGLVGLNLVIS